MLTKVYKPLNQRWLGMLPIQFSKTVSVEQIESACKKAADELGLETKLEDVFVPKTAGEKEVPVYDHSVVNIYKPKPIFTLFGLNFLKSKKHILQVPDLKKDQSKDHIYLFVGECSELVTQELYEKYTAAILKYI